MGSDITENQAVVPEETTPNLHPWGNKDVRIHLFQKKFDGKDTMHLVCSCSEEDHKKVIKTFGDLDDVEQGLGEEFAKFDCPYCPARYVCHVECYPRSMRGFVCLRCEKEFDARNSNLKNKKVVLCTCNPAEVTSWSIKYALCKPYRWELGSIHEKMCCGIHYGCHDNCDNSQSKHRCLNCHKVLIDDYFFCTYRPLYWLVGLLFFLLFIRFETDIHQISSRVHALETRPEQPQLVTISLWTALGFNFVGGAFMAFVQTKEFAIICSMVGTAAFALAVVLFTSPPVVKVKVQKEPEKSEFARYVVEKASLEEFHFRCAMTNRRLRAKPTKKTVETMGEYTFENKEMLIPPIDSIYDEFWGELVSEETYFKFKKI